MTCHARGAFSEASRFLHALAPAYASGPETWAHARVGKAKVVGEEDQLAGFFSDAVETCGDEEDPRLAFHIHVALATLEVEHGAKPSSRRTTLRSLARSARALGRFDDALAAARTYAEICELGGTFVFDVGWVLGEALLDAGHAREALPLLEEYTAYVAELHAKRPVHEQHLNECIELVARAKETKT